MVKHILIAAAALLIFSTAAETQEILKSDVDNLYWVAPSLYRSGQPSSKEMRELEQLGLKSILNLRYYHSDDDEAEETSLTLYRVKMKAGNISDENIIEALRIIRDAPKPLLIHCWHGSDRTGTVVAMYRIIFEEWDRNIALDELLQPEYGHHRRSYPNIPEYIRNVNIDKIRNAMAEP